MASSEPSNLPSLYNIVGRELRVALRCLGGICDSPSPRSHFDSSESLKSIQPEVASDLRVYNEQRKAYLPKIALEQDIRREGYYTLSGSSDKLRGLAFGSPPEQTFSVNRNEENHKISNLMQLLQEAEDGDCAAEDVSKKYIDVEVELVYEKPHQEEVSVGGEYHKNNLIQLEQEAERSCRDEDEDYAAKEYNDMEEDMELEWTVQKLCTKCNKNGDVLTCSSCPIVVHQRCLGFSASSKNGTFSCPSCTYSNAVAECTKAKREMSMFIGGTSGFQLQAQSKRVAEHEDMEKNNHVDHGETPSSYKHRDASSGFLDVDAILSEMKKNEEDGKKKSPNSRYSLRSLKRETPSVRVQTSTQHLGRRNRKMWSAEEEKTLKEGVRRFASGQAQSMPWINILEFGRSVFSSHRTTVDLKDKWRNMIRADPGLRTRMGV